MLLKQKFIYLLLGLVVFITLLIIRFAVIGGDEDTWVCDDGRWVKHGNPTAPRPLEDCP